jgi:signal peptidase I
MAEAELTEEQQLDRNIKRKRMLIKRLKHDLIVKIIVFVLAVIVTFTFIFGITRVSNGDMHPTVEAGDWLLYLRPGDYLNTDVVIYKAVDGRQRIGRVQATEGSALDQTEDGRLTVDGSFQPVQPESGMYYETYLRDDGMLAVPAEVGHDQYLVLGDDRKNAKDSRDFGLIGRKDIKGKVLVVIRRRPL